MVTERKRKVPIRLLYRFDGTTRAGYGLNLQKGEFHLPILISSYQAPGYYMRKRERGVKLRGRSDVVRFPNRCQVLS